MVELNVLYNFSSVCELAIAVPEQLLTEALFRREEFVFSVRKTRQTLTATKLSTLVNEVA